MYFCRHNQKRQLALKRCKHIILGVLWSVIGLSVLLAVLTRVPAVQRQAGRQVAVVLSEKFGTEVKTGRVSVGLFNRLTADDFVMYDQQGKQMLSVGRMSAKFDMKALLKGKVRISSVQLFGPSADFYQDCAGCPPNYQFALDSLASKDTTRHSALDVAVNSIVIRHGSMRYDRKDLPEDSSVFSPHHLNIKDISTHAMLNLLTDDSLDVNVKRLSLTEKSGLKVSQLALHLKAGKRHAEVEDFRLVMPGTDVTVEHLTADYRHKDGKLDQSTLKYEGRLNQSKVGPKDLACLVPELKNVDECVYLSGTVAGTAGTVRVGDVNVRSSAGTVNLQGKGIVSDLQGTPAWQADIDNLNVNGEGLKRTLGHLNGRVSVPEEVTRLGTIHYEGKAAGRGDMLSLKGQLETDAGDATLAVTKRGDGVEGHVRTDGVDLRKITDDASLGMVAGDASFKGRLKGSPTVTAKGDISRLDYNGYSYRDIRVDGTYAGGSFDGLLSVRDPNADLDIKGSTGALRKSASGDLAVNIRHLNPGALGLSSSLKSYPVDDVRLDIRQNGQGNTLSLKSAYADLDIEGQYEYATLPQSIANLIGSKLPTLPGLPRLTGGGANDFTVKGKLYDSEWLETMFGVPLQLHDGVSLEGSVCDRRHEADLTLLAPDFAYDGTRFKDGYLRLTTPDDTLRANLHVDRVDDDGLRTALNVVAKAADNKLNSLIAYRIPGSIPMEGQLDMDTQFFRTDEGDNAAHINIHPSTVQVGDTIWRVEPSDVVYSKNNLVVDHFSIHHDDQHIIVSGKATADENDSIYADLQDINVEYVLNLVNFHSVDFGGKASGRAFVTSAFKQPQAAADLKVRQFTFQGGDMGVLDAHVNYNRTMEQLDIRAVAEDGPDRQTYINGYVSPARNYIDLGIRARNTSLAFMEGFCGSFMENVRAKGNGDVRLAGDLSEINLTGQLIADGPLTLSPLACTYDLDSCLIRLIPDEIIFPSDTIHDRFGHDGIVTGAVHHKHLTRLSYDLDIKADNLLAYDTREFGDNTFYGTVYGTGDCTIRGNDDEVTIDINARPEKGSQIVYNVSSPDEVNNTGFIVWRDMTPRKDSIDANGLVVENFGDEEDSFEEVYARTPKIPEITSDLHINFLINATQDLTLKLLMDKETGDYIALNGDGVIRATYYDKGTFDMFGTYLVDHGIYKLTVQNVIKKDFRFSQGGTIIFGGDPLQSAINLSAVYTVNGVSLSDLNIGRSFSSNNIRVNCLMNITGTPEAPKIDFGLDMPTVNSDAKQMIYSLINSEEEMNQQVLYLLAIGRFYTQGSNNAAVEDAAQQSQTSLAMQSILSGTLSQQINNVLSSMVNNSNWNFGANISTGDEGFNNAEYEGLVSGRLLNNRLLINGEFGYRDNQNATTSFIGDFDIRYLLFPNGNLAINVYNQTNDRYFTKNSLNTQGVGLIMKKDFNSWKDLFRKVKKP